RDASGCQSNTGAVRVKENEWVASAGQGRSHLGGELASSTAVDSLTAHAALRLLSSVYITVPSSATESSLRGISYAAKIIPTVTKAPPAPPATASRGTR